MTSNMSRLYKLDNTGKIREWDIWTQGNTIYVRHGLKDGKKNVKITTCEGKNIGKANETSPEEQALLEMQSKINKQKDKLYTEDIAQIDKKDFRPMLAKEYGEFSHKVNFPAFVSYKLDGVRCNIKLEGNKIVARSRQGKEWPILDHITDELKDFFPNNSSIILDGELYIHKGLFEDMVGVMRLKVADDRTRKLKFRIYDCYDEDNPDWNFKDRLEFIKTIEYTNTTYLDSKIVNSEEEIITFFEDAVSLKYEGAMVRNNTPYEQKRTANLLKVKEFIDKEFLIVGIKTDKNNEKVLECTITEKKDSYTKEDLFEVKPEGSYEYRSSLDESVIGKMITVKFFEYTKNNKPRFPVGKGIRDYE